MSIFPVSYKPEVMTVGSPGWSSNALRFASRGEAKDYVENLAYRWSSVTETRVVESEDPVTHVWRNGQVEERKP